MGPGDIIKPLKIVAGSDMVAVDSYCCHLMGHRMGEVLTLKKAEKAGIRKIDFSQLNITKA